MLINNLKRKVSKFAIKYIRHNSIIGIGSGSTISYFIDELKYIKHHIKGVISSSNISSNKIKELNIPILDLNSLNSLEIYFDSADEIDNKMQMIKGGGGALTREKIIASVAQKFICIADISKLVSCLGNFPLPIEVIPMSYKWVSREIKRIFNCNAVCRNNFITDNGNFILDVHNLKITDAIYLEKKINNIPGVVTVGIFANRKADLVILSSEKEIKILS